MSGAVPMAAAMGSCSASDFNCTKNAECRIDTIAGFCEPNRYCSFPAADCDSGRRYGGRAGGGLAGTCVAADAATTTDSSDDTTTTDTSAGPGTGDTTSTADATDSDGVDGSSGSDSTSGGPAVWVDDFERPDSASLGNGWIERTPGAFAIEGGVVVFESDPTPYEDSVFYRPFVDLPLDAEASVEFFFAGADLGGTPQIHMRIQEDDLGTAGSLTAYLLFCSGAESLTLVRVDSGEFGLGTDVILDPPLLTGFNYRLRLSVSGTDPVQLTGILEVEGTRGWTVVETLFLEDAEPTRIRSVGSFGASGHLGPSFYYDNFTITPL